MNTRSLSLFVGTLSLLLGLWAVLSDTAAMGMAAGAVGFVAGLMVLLPAETHGPAANSSAESTSSPTSAGNSAAGDSATADPATADAGTDNGQIPEQGSAGEAVSHGFLDTGSSDTGPDADPLLQDAALMDPETDLFSEGYLKVALKSRLASARRHLRPVAVALVEVSEGLPDRAGPDASAKTVAEAVSRTIRDSDIACRMDDGTFAVILEDTPENGAVWTVERIRRNLVSSAGHHTLWAGVACYPAHAFDGPELLTAVRQALEAAKAWNQDRIEVAIAD